MNKEKFNMVEKIIISPQIVIYKKIFKYNEDLIDIIKNSTENFTEWSDWYIQGGKKTLQHFFSKKFVGNEKEINCLNELISVFEYVKKDYLKEYGNSNYIWPKDVDWNEVLEKKQSLIIDVYKYDFLKIKEIYADAKDKLMMTYHVDELSPNSNIKYERNLVTVNLYPNDDYLNGECCIYDPINDKIHEYKTEAGDMLIFPAGEPFFHAANLFEKADRYFVRNFIHYISGNIENKEENLKILEEQRNQYSEERMKKMGYEIALKRK
jgi:hypothetical protein